MALIGTFKKWGSQLQACLPKPVIPPTQEDEAEGSQITKLIYINIKSGGSWRKAQ